MRVGGQIKIVAAGASPPVEEKTPGGDLSRYRLQLPRQYPRLRGRGGWQDSFKLNPQCRTSGVIGTDGAGEAEQNQQALKGAHYRGR